MLDSACLETQQYILKFIYQLSINDHRNKNKELIHNTLVNMNYLKPILR